ncbi:MAG: NAD(P)-binding domain-containing protein [Gammaproteobacteria bacterium]|jgi:pyrroline-5-carboxylate reductase|nr:NAD(P)-binding domain-containing protein [Gammaproteobacteria bacterium]
MKTIGFIGVGELALYTIRGVRRGGYHDSILLSPRNRARSALLAADFNCTVLADNQAVVDRSDCVVIATRPADCLQTLAELEFRTNQLLISVVAGVEIEALRSSVPDSLDIVRAMPVSSAEAGASPTLIYPDNAFVREFFDYCGNTIPVDSEAYFTQGSVLACVYCWFFSLFESLIQATQGPELPGELSAELVMGMARGAAELALAKTDSSPGEIAAAIATDGTYSKLGLDLLQQQTAFVPWQQACELLQKRLAADD